MKASGWAVLRLVLVGAVLFLMAAQGCLLLWGGQGAFSQVERLLGLLLALVVLVILLWVKTDE
jgi:hypothetical protein